MARPSGRFCSLAVSRAASRGRYSRVLAFAQHWLILAQEGAAPAAGNGAGGSSDFLRMMLPLAVIMILFYFLMIRPQKKKESDFQRMVAGLKENDHVVTIGGIHGVVTNVQRDAERITVRIDESTGTKIRINASAIARVVTDDDNGSSKKESK
jgi:preprotein translocase subunit YajC